MDHSAEKTRAQKSAETRKRKRDEEEGNDKALVVNFRRLIEIKEKLDIIHEVIKATTIALLTLLAVADGFRLAYDLGFLVCGIALYALHEISHDALDIDDYKRIVGLLGNDGDDVLDDAGCPGGMENPNRCVQALSFSRHGRHRLLAAAMMTFFVVICTFSWLLVWNVWYSECNWNCQLGWSSPGDKWDIEHYVTLLVVGTLMLMCHFIYEALYAREFKYIMPTVVDARLGPRPWDLDSDGIPKGNLNWLFGLPCVWFSSRQAYEDLRVFVTLASGLPTGHPERLQRTKERHQHTVRQVFYEEMAVYALEDAACAARLRRSLLGTFLYDKQSKRFLRETTFGEDSELTARHPITMTHLHPSCTDGKTTKKLVEVSLVEGVHAPTQLGIELLFYDNRSGEIWVPAIPKERELDAPVRLRHEASLRKDRSFFGEMTK